MENELINYLFNSETNIMRPVSDSEFNGCHKNETLIAQFQSGEDCEQFETAVRRLRPDIKWDYNK